MQEKRSAALIVVDTLREDFAGGLEGLKSSGFVRFSNAVSTSSWTLPSHASMFTGELPSRHLVHVSPGVHMGNMMQRSRARLGESKSNVLKAMKDNGYKRYCYTCNPLVTPRFGFEFDWFREYWPPIGVSQLQGVLPSEGSTSSRAWAVLKAGRVGLLLKLGTTKARRGFNRRLNRPLGDKGSRQALRDLRRASFSPPFFVYLNLMEAHEPYRWGEPTDATRVSMLGRPVGDLGWGRGYAEGSAAAVRGALEAVDELLKYDPMIVVTSDHGQLLGEGGRYGHGYFLDEELLRVPLYVRFPSGSESLQQDGGVVSLTQVHTLLSWAAGHPAEEIGSEEAVAECFGPHHDLSSYLPGEAGAEALRKMYAVKRRVFSKDGSVLYNVSDHREEGARGSVSKEEEARLAGVAESLGEPPATPEPPLSAAEEADITERLSQLGYV